MASKTSISWTQTRHADGTVTQGATWNPLRGCTKVSEGCRFCLAPDTPILYADMAWRPLGEVSVGDALAAFDEQPAPGFPRKFRVATVQAVWWSSKDAMRLTFPQTEVVATEDHRWLMNHKRVWSDTRNLHINTPLRFIGVTPPPVLSDEYRVGYLSGMTLGDGTLRYSPGQGSAGRARTAPQAWWRVALVERDEAALGRIVSYLAHLGVGAQIRGFQGDCAMRKVEIRSLPTLAALAPLLTGARDSLDYKRGFLAGFYDAEGSAGDNLRMAQKDADVLRRVQGYAADLGFSFDVEGEETARVQDRVATVRLRGTLLDRMRFLQTIGPALARKTGLWGRRMQQESAPLLAREKAGRRDVVDIQTSTGTFYAAGLATHNCYAMGVAERFSGPGQPYEGTARLVNGRAEWTNTIKLVPEKLSEPIRWQRPRLIFVNSMSDLFHPEVPDSYIDRVWGAMALAPQHTFQVLTKRPERMAAYLSQPGREQQVVSAAYALASAMGMGDYPETGRIGATRMARLWVHLEHRNWPLRNVWLGTSVESNEVLGRVEALRHCPATTRFLSCEPLLETLTGLDYLDLSHVHQIICGGESGNHLHQMKWAHRMMGEDAPRHLRDLCARQGIAFWMKQHSAMKSGQRPYVVELDGSHTVYHEYPRGFTPPEVITTGDAL